MSFRCVFLIAGVLVSFLISALFYSHYSEINPDGFCYLGIAEAWSSLSLKHMMQVCPQAKWPFYSILIALLDQWFHIHDLARAAWAFNAVLSAGTWVFMMLIMHRLGASYRAQLIGGVLFLLFQDWLTVRPYIVRDHGYWFFYFASIFFFSDGLLCTHWKARMQRVMLFFVSMACAVLFRIEGAFILNALPLSIFFLKEWSWSTRWRWIAVFYLPLLAGVSIVLLCIASLGWVSLDAMGRFPELVQQVQLWWGRSALHYQRGLEYYRHVFPYYDVHHFFSIWIAQLVTAYGVQVIKTLSVLYALILLIGYRWVQRDLNALVKISLCWAIGLNMVLNFLFFTEALFTTNRYVMAMVLSMLIFVPLILDQWLVYAKGLRRWVVYGVMGACCIQMVCALHSGMSRVQNNVLLHDAAAVLRDRHISREQLYINDSRVLFYAYFAPNQYKTFVLLPKFSRFPYDQLSQEKNVAMLFYDRSGQPFLETSTEDLNRLSEWKVEWKKQDDLGRQAVLYSKPK